MQLTQLFASNTLLAYSLVTSPAPVQVSPQSGPPSIASLTLVISCPLTVSQITVSQINFNLPVGDPKNPDATDLTDTATGISPSVSSSGTDPWQIGPGAAAGSFVLKPGAGGSGVITSQGLTVTFIGIQVSPIVGTAMLSIVEVATADSTSPQPRQCSIAVPKFPYGFYAGNFDANVPMVQNGQTVILSWIGSVQAVYTMLWAKSSQDVSKVNQWTSPALTDTTTFILEVSAQHGGQTVKLYFSLTVVVANPDITATALQVLTTSSLAGNVTVGSASAAAVLTVNGTSSATTVNAGTLNSSGAATLAGLSVPGAATLGSLTIPGAANIGSVQTSNLSAGTTSLGATTINGLNARAGQVAMTGGPQAITPGSWQTPAAFRAPTDGFAIGVIGNPASFTDGCMCWGFGQSNGVTVFVTGGNVGYFGPAWSDYMGSNPNSFILPVAAGATFYIAVQQGTAGQQSNAPYWFYWVPVGSGTVAGPLLEYDQPGPDFQPPLPVTEGRPPTSSSLEFITILERLLGKPIDETTRQQLLSCTRRF